MKTKLIRGVAALLVATLFMLGQANAQDSSGRMPIGDFVAQLFFHGVPYEEVLAYGPGAVPELITILQDPGREAHWANAAVMLAMIGDQRGVDAVTAFIKEPGAGEVTSYRNWARGNAVLALGYAAHNGRNRSALQYLETSLQPGVWRQRGARGARGGRSAAESEQEVEDEAVSDDEWLTHQALVGLAVSGTPEGRRALERFKTAPGQGARQQGTIDALLEEHAKIARQGLRGYDRERIERAEGRPVKPVPGNRT